MPGTCASFWSGFKSVASKAATATGHTARLLSGPLTIACGVLSETYDVVDSGTANYLRLALGGVKMLNDLAYYLVCCQKGNNQFILTQNDYGLSIIAMIMAVQRVYMFVGKEPIGFYLNLSAAITNFISQIQSRSESNAALLKAQIEKIEPYGPQHKEFFNKLAAEIPRLQQELQGKHKVLVGKQIQDFAIAFLKTQTQAPTAAAAASDEQTPLHVQVVNYTTP